MIIGRVIHLITLQLLCLPSISLNSFLPDGNVSTSSGTNTTTNIRSNASLMETLNTITYYNYFLPTSSTSTSSNTNATNTTTNTTITNSSSFCAPNQLLNILIEIYKSPLLKDDDYYFSGLQWILYQFYKNNTQLKDILIQQNITFGLDQKDNKISATKTLAERKLEAQKRAMAAMSKQVQTFSKAFDLSEDDDNNDSNTGNGNKLNIEDDNEGDDNIKSGNETMKKLVDRTLEDQATECILCHEKSNNVIGYLSFTQYSNIISNSIILETSTSTGTSMIDNNKTIPNLKKMYRVTAIKGCPVYAQCNENSNIIGHLNHGVHVYAIRRIGK